MKTFARWIAVGFSGMILAGCAHKHLPPPVEQQSPAPPSNVRTDLTDTRDPYAVDQLVPVEDGEE